MSEKEKLMQQIRSTEEMVNNHIAKGKRLDPNLAIIAAFLNIIAEALVLSIPKE